VADEQAVVTLFDNIEKDFGGIDGLINNAGITKDSLLVKVKEGKVVGKRCRSTIPIRSSP
jgi:3-oxoacyl-[acyl-carrier protein] reductase